MELFYGVLLMLGAILLSNLINRFVPSFSVPIIQIILGVIISLLPSVYHFKLDNELFLILFLAPLLFHDGMLADKGSLWALRKPIIMLALGLVFFTVVAAGCLIHFMIPDIPLPAAFALAAALAPTDAVAVGSLGKKIKIPESIRNLLEGEALINDASGIVSFQFAVTAMVTGNFSLLHAGINFLYVALGGVIIGIVLTALKYILVKWVRSLGMENITFHLLIGILTPFIIFMAAEELHVSGILAVVISGVIHSFERRKLNPELATLNIASKSVWSTLAFILNGLVFLILGTQLPEIINVIWYDITISNLKTLGYVLAITAALMVIRFLWSYFVVGDGIKGKSTLETQGMGSFKSSLVISMSGVRGSVTLATSLSLPLLLSNGKEFPQRDMIIFLAAGVILCSLLTANFLMPLLFRNEKKEENTREEREACLEILENVIKQLNDYTTAENRLEIGRVTRDFTIRAEELRSKNYRRGNYEKKERELRKQVLGWEEENTKTLLAANEINEEAAMQYLEAIEKIRRRNENQRRFYAAALNRFFKNMKSRRKWGVTQPAHMERRAELYRLRLLNNEYILKLLRERKKKDNSPSVNKLIAEYERMDALFKSRRGPFDNREEIHPSQEKQENYGRRTADIGELLALGFQMERDGIQAMFEEGRISWDTAHKLRNNIALMELQLKKDEF